MSDLVELPRESYPKDVSAPLSDCGEYSFGTAGAMAWLSQLAYETDHPDKIDDVLRDWGLTKVEILQSPPIDMFPRIHTRGLVVRGWGGTIIAFAGTDPRVLENWFTNFSTLPSPSGLHTGFERAAGAVAKQLRSAVLARDATEQPLFVTGHSLGGALAVIAANSLASDPSTAPAAVYTFGMPRCGGREFAQEYRSRLGQRTYRLVKGNDIVPAVPPSFFGFRHVGQFLACPAAGAKFDPMQQPQVGESNAPSLIGAFWQAARDDFRTLATFELPPRIQPGKYSEAFRSLPAGVRDHIPVSYLTALGFRP